MEFNHEAKSVSDACGYTKEELNNLVTNLQKVTDGSSSMSQCIEKTMDLLTSEKEIAMFVHASLSNAKIVEKMRPLLSLTGMIRGLANTEDCQCEDCVAERAGKTEVKDETVRSDVQSERAEG